MLDRLFETLLELLPYFALWGVIATIVGYLGGRRSVLIAFIFCSGIWAYLAFKVAYEAVRYWILFEGLTSIVLSFFLVDRFLLLIEQYPKQRQDKNHRAESNK